MPGLANPRRAFQLQLHADHLGHAIVLEIGVFRRERGCRIDTRHIRVNGLLRIGIEIDVRRLSDFDFSDAPFRHEAAQIDLAEIEQTDDGGPRP